MAEEPPTDEICIAFAQFCADDAEWCVAYGNEQTKVFAAYAQSNARIASTKFGQRPSNHAALSAGYASMNAICAARTIGQGAQEVIKQAMWLEQNLRQSC